MRAKGVPYFSGTHIITQAFSSRDLFIKAWCGGIIQNKIIPAQQLVLSERQPQSKSIISITSEHCKFKEKKRTTVPPVAGLDSI